jgi:hypothetical protein
MGSNVMSSLTSMEGGGTWVESNARPAGPDGTAVRELSVFFPAYNEAPNLERTVENALVALEQLSLRRFEMVIVNDGSTDETGMIADELSAGDPRIGVVHHPVNRGYGAALKSGFGAAQLEWIFFSDSDGQFDLTEIKLLLPFTNDADAIIGYRTSRSDHAVRKINTFLLSMLVRAVFKLRIRDVDCAFKLLRHASLEGIGPLESEGAMISTEMLVKLQHAGARVTEVGVSHYPRTAGTPSGANPKVIARALRELIALRRSLRQSRAETAAPALELDRSAFGRSDPDPDPLDVG